MRIALLLLICLAGLTGLMAKLAERECEVCIKVLGELDAKGKDLEKLEKEFRQKCKKMDGVEKRFCYYIGATDDAATSIVQQGLKPLIYGKPAIKVCEDLKKKDSQICQLRFETKIDIHSVDLSKLKIADLRKVIKDHNLDCSDCVEKGDFLKVINAHKAKNPKKEL